jgi:hypothetical protein
MADMTSSLTTPQTDTEAEATLEQILKEMQQISTLIQQEQREIDRLKAESRVITAHTDAVLSRLRVQLDALEAAR